MKFPRQRTLFTAPTVAEICGVPQNTINSYLSRGLLPISMSTAPKHGNARQYGADNMATLLLMRDLIDSMSQRPEFAAILADTCAAEFLRQMFGASKEQPFLIVRLGGSESGMEMAFADGMAAAMAISEAWEGSARPFFLCIDILKIWQRVLSALADRGLEPLLPEEALPADYVSPTYAEPLGLLSDGKIDSTAIYARLNASRKPGAA